MHPSYPVSQADLWLQTRLQNIFSNASLWAHTAICIYWDDGGGFYDHVAVPHTGVDAVGYGPRVPLVGLSPYAIASINNMQLEPASILKWLASNFSFTYTTGHVSTANSASVLFNLNQAPIPAPVTGPAVAVFARKEFDDPDLVTLVRRLFHGKHEVESEREELANVLELQPRPCMDGTKPHFAYYITATGKYPVEVCGNDDGSLIEWHGQSVMDADEKDERLTKGITQ